MDRIGRWMARQAVPPQVDRDALRAEMTRTDPEFAHVQRVQHDAMNALAAKAIRDGLAIRREREFWERSGR